VRLTMNWLKVNFTFYCLVEIEIETNLC
jgi:hypothetical protein